MSEVLGEFAEAFDRCWLCGIKAINTWPPRLETHHIVRGPSRKKAAEERCVLIRTCQRCHQERLDSMEIATQLALKAIYDPKHYDRVRVNTLRNRMPDAVSEGEVRVRIIELQATAMGWAGHPFPAWVS